VLSIYGTSTRLCDPNNSEPDSAAAFGESLGSRRCPIDRRHDESPLNSMFEVSRACRASSSDCQETHDSDRSGGLGWMDGRRSGGAGAMG
jgi:hypothetical protein